MTLNPRFLRRDARSEPALKAAYESTQARDTVTCTAPPTLPIFVHGSLMLPEMLLIYLNKETLTQARESALDMDAARHANEPLVVCPATLHGYHRRQYNEKSLEPREPQQPQTSTAELVTPPETHKKEPTSDRSLANLIRKTSIRWRLFKRSQTQRDLSRPESEAEHRAGAEDDELGGLLFPYVLPGPTFDSAVDGVLFYPRSKEEYDKFIRTFNKDHTDIDDGETIIGAQILDVEVFLDEAFEQHGSRMVKLKGGKVNHNCWNFIKEFDNHQREDPYRPTSHQVPEVRHYVQSTPGFQENVTINKDCHPCRYIHPDEEDNGLETSPARSTIWPLSNAADSGQSTNGKRNSTFVKAIVFIAGTVSVTDIDLQRNQMLKSSEVNFDSARRLIRQSGFSRSQSTSSLSALAGFAKGLKRSTAAEMAEESREGMTMLTKRRRAGYNRAGLLESGEKWSMKQFRDSVAPRLLLGVEQFYRSTPKPAVERERGTWKGRLRRWGSNLRIVKDARKTKTKDDIQATLEAKEEFVPEDEKNETTKNQEKIWEEIIEKDERAGETVEVGVENRRRSTASWLWSRLFGSKSGTGTIRDLEAGEAELEKGRFPQRSDSLRRSWLGSWRAEGERALSGQAV